MFGFSDGYESYGDNVRKKSKVVADAKKAPNRIRFLRERRQLDQYQLANLIETKQGVVSRLERGVLPLNDDWIKKLAGALNCKPHQLFSSYEDVVDAPLPKVEIKSSIAESQDFGEMPLFAAVRRGVGKVDIDAGQSRLMDRPTYLLGVKGAFGIRIVDQLLRKLEVNEIACVDPTYVVVPGNIVAVVYTEGTADVLKLSGETKNDWHFTREIPKEQQIIVSKEKVRDVFRVRGQEYAL
jgi:transcriptional regulator with XRE-family HTH domain